MNGVQSISYLCVFRPENFFISDQNITCLFSSTFAVNKQRSVVMLLSKHHLFGLGIPESAHWRPFQRQWLIIWGHHLVLYWFFWLYTVLLSKVCPVTDNQAGCVVSQHQNLVLLFILNCHGYLSFSSWQNKR
jgi:hypothetical protein